MTSPAPGRRWKTAGELLDHDDAHGRKAFGTANRVVTARLLYCETEPLPPLPGGAWWICAWCRRRPATHLVDGVPLELACGNPPPGYPDTPPPLPGHLQAALDRARAERAAHSTGGAPDNRPGSSTASALEESPRRGPQTQPAPARPDSGQNSEQPRQAGQIAGTSAGQLLRAVLEYARTHPQEFDGTGAEQAGFRASTRDGRQLLCIRPDAHQRIAGGAGITRPKPALQALRDAGHLTVSPGQGLHYRARHHGQLTAVIAYHADPAPAASSGDADDGTQNTQSQNTAPGPRNSEQQPGPDRDQAAEAAAPPRPQAPAADSSPDQDAADSGQQDQAADSPQAAPAGPGRAQARPRLQLAAVLDTDGLWYPGADRPLDVPMPKNAADAYRLAERAGIRQLWFHPRVHQALGLPEQHGPNPAEPEPCAWFDLPPGWDADPAGAAAWVNLAPGTRGNHTGPRRALVFPAWENRADWAGAPDGATTAGNGRVLADAIAAFANAMPPGCHYYLSPNETARAVWLHHTRGRELPPVTWPAPALAPAAPVGVPAWSRVLTDDEDGCTWLHRLDESRAQLSTYNVILPAGEPVHHASPLWIPGQTKKHAAYLLARLDPGWTPDLRIPDPRWPWQHAAADAIWITVPHADYLITDLRAPVEPLESWTWPDSSARLQATGKSLRLGRDRLLEEAAATCGRCGRCGNCTALSVSKTLYATMTGWLNRRPGTGEDGDSETGGGSSLRLDTDETTGLTTATRSDFLPYGNHAIRAAFLANRDRRIIKAGTASGRWPCAVSNDALYYATDDPDPATALPPPLQYGHKGGQYKPEARIPLAAVREHLGTPRFHRAVEEWLAQHPRG